MPTSRAMPSSRSASAVVAKAEKGFHVFRIDGYSLAEKLPGGECVTSAGFTVGGREWHIELYPNGADPGKDAAASVSLFLRMEPRHRGSNCRVRAQYMFSLLDAAGAEQYELPGETAVFTCGEERDGLRHGYGDFIRKEALRRRRDSLLQDDCVAVRCDVWVTELRTAVSIGVKHSRTGGGCDTSDDDSSDDSSSDSDDDGSDSDSDDERSSRRKKKKKKGLDDKEYVKLCLAERRPSAS